KSGMTKDEMRTVLMNERQVELAYEDHRYWDVRRWKTAPQNQNVDMKAMKITRTVVGSTTTYTYQTVPISTNVTHVFKDFMYFFPIMQTEMAKNPGFIQNPGY